MEIIVAILTTALGAFIGTLYGSKKLYEYQQSGKISTRKIAIKAIEILKKYANQPFENTKSDFTTSLSSIAIPTIAGGTYSPDFMYVVRKVNGEKELSIIVETKDVENKSILQGAKDAKIKCTEIFFKNFSA